MSQLPLLLGLGSFGVSATLVVLSLGRGTDRVRAGVDQIGAYYAQSARVVSGPVRRSELSPLLDRLRRISLRILSAKAVTKIQHKLDVAGNPARWDTERVLAAKAGGMVGVALFGFLLRAGHGGIALVAAVGGAVAGFYLPDLLIYNNGVKRQEKIQKALPDAMDMMTVCVEAGLGFDSALAQVARNTSGPLASEFARVLQEMQFGMSRTEALKALAERTTVSELRVLVSALVQASELGIPVAAVMREQAKEMRLRRRQRAEEKAQKVTVKILFPLIFCLLPALFIIVIGPGVISIMHSFSGV